jgi:5-methyltetrahydrofolate--homocysteine methyltransferase
LKDLRKFLKENIVLLDGAMGTLLQQSGADITGGTEEYNITNPSLIRDIHKKYIESGAQIIYTNTFGAHKVPKGFKLSEIIRAAVENAKSAANGKAFVAYDMGPSGKVLEPSGDFTFDQAYELFKEQAESAQNNGVDLIVCETFMDLYEIKAAVLAVKENTSLPVICSMSFDRNGRTVFGTDAGCMALTLEGLGADCIGINCSLGPDQILPIAEELIKWTDLPVIVKANAGIPRPDGSYSISPAEFAEAYDKLLNIGVTVIGGCCGTSPEYIAALRELINGKKPSKRKSVNLTAVCSYNKTVIIDGVKIVGERLNPTGKKLYREALKSGDYDFIISEGLKQKDAGADILDVNTGLPEIDEAQVMMKTIKALQSLIDLPLQIDSSNPVAIEKALRYYNGKPIVNSVNGDEETLNNILPIVRKYGACIIGLTLDKKGLPDSTEKRLKIADKIFESAAKYNIKTCDVIIDALALTVSTEQPQVAHTLEAIKILNKRGVKTLLGISNISYGLPARENINLTFLVMALTNGLNLPIINPCCESIMNTVKAFNVLSGNDKNAEKYINALGGGNLNDDVSDLNSCVLKGLKTECAAICIKLLEKTDINTLVNTYIIPALDNVGNLFDKGKIFLPQLINSAETIKYAFEEIKKKLPRNSIKSGNKIILATVKGDIHDIGKNIVATVLENYGYDIIDLGKNVEPQAIIDAAVKYGVKLIGLSALMTTTVSSMEATIKLIRQSGHICCVMVGGAVLTEEYAKKIGADYYAKDAVAAAKIAKEIFK